MESIDIKVSYNTGLEGLADLLGEVERAGTFATSGGVVAPMPGLEIEGVGRIAFPLLPVQAEAIAGVAEQAPYGKGEQTIVDREVRDVLQVNPGNFQLSGKTWPETLRKITDEVARDLACTDFEVEAELYKILLYQEGGFFVNHRDTEKSGGMFGTLVISLPSVHKGGDLVVRHATGEKVFSLVGGEDAELRYAAFYADCQHEVRPVESGNRLCLVYNLLRGESLRGKKKVSDPSAPDYRSHVSKAADMLREWKARPGRPSKIVYLMEHHYTPESLGFSALKLQDAARSGVLCEAAEQAGYAAHLALVHIYEAGSAQILGGYDYRWRGRYDYDEEEEEDGSDVDFETIDAFDWSQTVDEWVGLDGQPAKYGPLPLEDGELLPAGALDNEVPDDVELEEATGNEGASYEWSYFCAAIVLWPLEGTEEMLLSSGPWAAVPYFRQLVDSPDPDISAIQSLAGKITRAWEAQKPEFEGLTLYHRKQSRNPALLDMLDALAAFADPGLVLDFLVNAASNLYIGEGNPQHLRAFQICGEEELAGQVAPAFVSKHVELCLPALADLFAGDGARQLPDSGLFAATSTLASSLEKIQPLEPLPTGPPKSYSYRGMTFNVSANPTKPAEDSEETQRAQALARWILALYSRPGTGPHLKELTTALQNFPGALPPDRILSPILETLAKEDGADPTAEASPLLPLWLHTARFHLGRSSAPPAGPSDWKLEGQQTDCQCDDCMTVNQFALDPDEQTLRLPRRKDLRQHLHNKIDRAEMEMTHETERKGSPHTLVLTKTRWGHEARLKEYQADLRRIAALAKMAGKPSRPAEVQETQSLLCEALDAGGH